MRYVVRMGETKNAYRILSEKHFGRRSLGEPGRRWKDDTEVDNGEIF
jgi:hypothetical protein